MSLNRLVGFVAGVVGVLLFAAVAVYFYLFIFLSSPPIEQSEQTEQTTYPVAYPQSVKDSDLYLTLRLGVEDFQLPTLYSASADTGMKLRFDNLTAVDEVVSPSARESAFIAFPSEALAQEFDIPTDSMQVMIFDETRTISPLTTSVNNPRKRAPQWSPAGDKIAFMATSSKELVSEGVPEMWDVFVTDLEGNETFVTSGAHPHWSADGESLYVVKTDGVALVDVETGEEELIYQSRAALYWDIFMLVDNNHRYLALIGPRYNLVVVFQISSEDTLTELRRFNTPVSGAIFSPDGSLLATLYSMDEATEPQLSFTNWRTGEVIETLSLTGFATDYLFLTDWVSR